MFSEVSVCSLSSAVSENSATSTNTMENLTQYQNRDFKIIVDLKTSGENHQQTIHLVAPTIQVRNRKLILNIVLQLRNSRGLKINENKCKFRYFWRLQRL